ncbi:MAG: putative mycofactocin-associated electron transfer flavoprotein [Actinobacteria bacterium]|nr:putative mycofactocin-associated electron transfer flavoprotein [Actinomycetota bacterium]
MIVACLKWCTPAGDAGDRLAGASAADRAALELALAAGATLGLDVVALTAGPPAAERVLRDALACGATRALRIDAPIDIESRDVGAALAGAATGARMVVCGDHSLDRGSGSVPAFIAHHLGVAQALGLVSINLGGSTADSLHAVRRLDGGRRELLDVPLPCVLSVESSVATLRRAPLRRALEAERASIESRGVSLPQRTAVAAVVSPFRPRARELAPPTGAAALDRIRELTDAGSTPARGEIVELDPRAAAARIAAALRDWGYLETTDGGSLNG